MKGFRILGFLDLECRDLAIQGLGIADLGIKVYKIGLQVTEEPAARHTHADMLTTRCRTQATCSLVGRLLLLQSGPHPPMLFARDSATGPVLQFLKHVPMVD